VNIRRKTLTGVALAGAAAVLLAGCASGAATEPEETTETSGAFPVEIENAFGTTVVESQPTNVAAVAWGNADVALALGIAPVGMPFITYADDNGDGILPWQQDALDEIGAEAPTLFDETDGINFEQVADSAPDVILAANSGLAQEEYDTLTEIAPTVSYPTTPWIVSWRESTLLNARALGLETEAEGLIADTESLLESAASEHPELDGKSVAYIWVDPSDTSVAYIYLPGDTRVDFLDEFGMVPSAGVEQLAEQNPGVFYASITSENIDLLADADVIVNYGGADTLAGLQADPLFGALPAIQRGSVAIVDESTPQASAYTTPTVLSIPWGLDDYVSLLGDAAAKVE
jgi:iron complex transport system substrate-binding protein